MRTIVFEEHCCGITIDQIIRNYEYTMPAKHMHEEYELYYLCEGERYYFIERQSFHVQKGDLVLINRRQIHKTVFANSPYHDRILIEFLPEPFSTFFSSFSPLNLDDYFEKNQGVIRLDDEGQIYIKQLLLDIHKEFHNRAFGFELSGLMKLAEVLIYAERNKLSSATLQDELPTPSYKHNKINEVALYITQEFTHKISLESLSQVFYINKCYLSRIFKEVTGLTVNEYINIHRIRLAQDLLRNTDLNISEIAEQVGYDSLTYFERVFKKFHEVSPLKYRKRYQTNATPSRNKRLEEQKN